MVRFLIFGDSITYGAWDLEGGWVQRLRNFLDKKTLADEGYYLVYNLGISGDTSKDLLERFDFETKQRLKEGDETIFLFEIGVNDCGFLISKNNSELSEKEFEHNLKELISKAQKISSKIVFVGIAPFDESRVSPVPWHKDLVYKNVLAKRFNRIIEKTCQENNLLFIDIFNKITQKDCKNFEDGAHPDSSGHEKIFEIIKKSLIKERVIS